MEQSSVSQPTPGGVAAADLSWQTRPAGRIVLRFRPHSYAAQDIDELANRYAEALATVSDALEVEADGLPTIAVYLSDLPSAGPDGEPAAAPGDEGSAQAELTIWTVYSSEAPTAVPEAELANALLAHGLGPPPPSARFWDEGLAGHLAARSGRSSYHAEATAHCRQLIADGLLPPLEELVAGSEARMSGLASTAATGFAAFLVERHGIAHYQRLLRLVHSGEAAAFESVYRNPLAVVDRNWRRSLESAGPDQGLPLLVTLRRLLPMARPYWRSGLAILGCALVGITFSLALPLSFRFLLDSVLARRPLREPIPFIGPSGYVISPGPEQLEALLKMLGFLGALYLLNAAARVGLNTLVNVVGESFAHDLRCRLVQVLGRLPAAYFARTPVADISQRIVQDTSAVQQVITRAVVPMVTGGISVVLFTVLLFSLEPKLALVALAGLPILGGIYRLRRRSRRAAARERVRRLADLSGGVNEAAAAQMLVKLYSAGPYFVDRLIRRMETHRKLNIAYGRESSLLGQVGALTIGLTQVAVLLAGGYLIIVSDGRDLAPGGLVAFYIVLNQLLAPVGQVANASQVVAGASANVERVSELLGEKPEPDDPNGVELGPLRESIRFEDVSFGYTPGQPVLRGLSLELPAAKTLALVGPTGAGKSSVLHLLPRLYEPARGRITWDGIDIRTARLSSLRRQIVLVPQESLLLSTTLYENIRFGLADVSDEEVQEAARLAQAHEFIVALPQGYDTVVGDRGVGLSGGQCQRIALARALLRKPAVLILDEATSALDSTTQRAVTEGLRAGSPDRMLIKIAHRLETIVDADAIFVLEDGRLVEQGKHDELVAAGGLYARLFEDEMGSLGGGAPGQLTPRQAVRRLARLAPFSELTPAELDRLAAALKSRTWRAGDTIYQQGSESDELFVVGRGRIDILALPETGLGAIDAISQGIRGVAQLLGIAETGPGRVLNTLGSGGTLGVASFLSGDPRPVTARAATEVLLYALERPAFVAAIRPREDPATGTAEREPAAARV